MGAKVDDSKTRPPPSFAYGVNGLIAGNGILNIPDRRSGEIVNFFDESVFPSNVAVVNIDNGFGAGYMASVINRV